MGRNFGKKTVTQQSTAKVINLENLSFPQLDALDRKKTVFVFPISPIEEHGPHLPLGVDAFTAEYFADQLAEDICQKWPAHPVVKHPLIPLGCCVLDNTGTITIRQSVIRDLLVDVLSSLAKYGFINFIIVNGHGGGGHVVALEEAARKVSRKFKCKAVSITGKLAYRFLSGEFMDEIDSALPTPLSEKHRKDFVHDLHAGQWETSMMLKLKPELVHPVYKTLNGSTATLKERLTRRNYAFEKGRQGYIGFPGRASEAFAEASISVLRKETLAIVEKMLAGADVLDEVTSPAWKLPIFRTHFWAKAILSITAILTLLLYFWLR